VIGGVLLVGLGFALGWVCTAIILSHAAHIAVKRVEELNRREEELDRRSAMLEKEEQRSRKREHETTMKSLEADRALRRAKAIERRSSLTAEYEEATRDALEKRGDRGTD
jgi:biopolymer transport protein ExbB/TolQ